ncbi:MAG: UDP-3-O-(3-hydroxymyristoyl)glucosamine N-acyltransferase [Bacteroidales bacterium]|nr:UDP-3-O-(3-hydroxymyristoyl)glucosamine N-acyltransferase [Bacteroidales bacterium]
MKFTAQQIANALNGSVEGRPEVEVSTLSKIEEGKPGSISFLANPIYTKYIYDTKADIVVVNEDFKPEKPLTATLIRVKDAYLAFTSLLEIYQNSKQQKTGISPNAAVAPSAKIGEGVYIGDFVSIGENTTIGNNVKIYSNTSIGDNCKIGNDTTIYYGVKIYSETVIGNECILHGGSVIGADGFGFAPQQNTDFKKIPQIGNVILEDRVEVGANTTIDRATMGSTIIRKGVKLDNLIQIAHNVEIGENTVIASQSGVSGSTKLGKNCMVAGQVGFVGHIKIADGVKVMAQSGISKSFTKPDSLIGGSPATNLADHQRSLIYLRQIESMVKRITELENKLKEMRGE